VGKDEAEVREKRKYFGCKSSFLTCAMEPAEPAGCESLTH
jgi:hypothetical protein